jgi:hypothetical protein
MCIIKIYEERLYVEGWQGCLIKVAHHIVSCNNSEELVGCKVFSTNFYELCTWHFVWYNRVALNEFIVGLLNNMKTNFILENQLYF